MTQENKERSTNTFHKVDLSTYTIRDMARTMNANVDILEQVTGDADDNIAELDAKCVEINRVLLDTMSNVSNNYSELSSKIDTKMNRGDKIKSSQLDTSSNSSKIGLNNLADEVHQAMSGNAPVNPTIPNGSIVNEKYAKYSITGEKTDFMLFNRNRYNPNTRTLNVYVHENSGSLQPHDSYDTSDFIYIDTEGQSIAITNCRKVVFYDINKNFVEGHDNRNNTALILNAPCEGYVRVTFSKTATNNQIEFGEEHTPYVPYGLTLGTSKTGVTISDRNIEENTISGTKITDNTISEDKVDFIVKRNNLFNPQGLIHRNKLVSQDGTDTLQDSNLYHTTDFIELPNNGVCLLKFVGARVIKWYNKEKKPLGFDNTFSGVPQLRKFQLHIQGACIRVSYYRQLEEELQISVTDEETGLDVPYVSYGSHIQGNEPMIHHTQLTQIPGYKIKRDELTVEHTNFIKPKGVNMLNPLNTQSGLINGHNGIHVSNSDYLVTEYIPLKAGVSYIARTARQYALYTLDTKEYITGKDLGGNTRMYVTPEQDCYIRFCYSKTYKDTNVFKIDEGNDVSETKEAFKLDIPFLHIEKYEEGVNAINELKPRVEQLEPLVKNPISANRMDFIELNNLLDMSKIEDGLWTGGRADTTSDVGVNYVHIRHIFVKAGETYITKNVRQVYLHDIGTDKKIGYHNIPKDGNSDEPFIFTVEQDCLATINMNKVYINNPPVLYKGDTLPLAKTGMSIPNLKVSMSQISDFKVDMSQIENLDIPTAWNKINLSNVDRIGFIGDSYTDSHYTPKGKAYINKLSLFSDYNFENMAVSGDTYRGQLDKIRNGKCKYHSKLSWKDFRPKYAVLTSYTNDLKYMNHEQYGNDLRAVIETVKSLGSEPIISTEYHKNFGMGLGLLLNQVASEYNCEVMDFTSRSIYQNNTIHNKYWGGSHPGVRANEVISNPMEKYLSNLPRPVQSMKIFRPRNGETNKENLKFNTNKERAKLFKEIMVGHSALRDPKYYDCLDTYSSNDVITSEYLKLQNKEKVLFNDIALVDCILPTTSTHLEGLRLNLDLSTTVTPRVWVLDTLKYPYSLPQYYRRFDVVNADSLNLTVGDKYYSSNYPSVTLTLHHIVKGTGDGGGDSLFFSPNNNSIPTRAGELIKVSGNGVDNIPYSYSAVGFDENYPTDKQIIGNWVEVPLTDGYYTLTTEQLVACVNQDKVSFLVEQSGAFNITNVEVEWIGQANKPLKAKPFKPVEYVGEEMITNYLVGNDLANWTVEGSITPYVPVDDRLPVNNTKCIDVSPTQKVKTTITYPNTKGQIHETPVCLKVLGRYFPPVFDPNTQNYPQDSKITEDSFDYVEVKVDVTLDGDTYTFKDLVGLHWTDLEFKFNLPYNTSSMEVKVYTDTETIQLAQVSLKTLS